jgi:hypothetical protein
MMDSISSAFESLDLDTLSTVVDREWPSPLMLNNHSRAYFTGPLRSVECEMPNSFGMEEDYRLHGSSTTVFNSSDSRAAYGRVPKNGVSCVERDELPLSETRTGCLKTPCWESPFMESLTTRNPIPQPYQLPALSSTYPMDEQSRTSIRNDCDHDHDFHDDHEATTRTACIKGPSPQRVYKPRKVFLQCKEYVSHCTELDVLCERGTRSNKHAGNQYYLQLVDNHRPFYRPQQQQQTSVSEKRRIVLEVIQMIHDRGGRFLEEDKKTKRWYVAPSKNVINKVGQALRDPPRMRHCVTPEMPRIQSRL